MHPAFQNSGNGKTSISAENLSITKYDGRNGSMDGSDDDSDDEEIDLTTNGCIDYSNNNKH